MAIETITKIINEIKDGHKFLTYRKFKLFLEKHKALHRYPTSLSSSLA